MPLAAIAIVFRQPFFYLFAAIVVYFGIGDSKCSRSDITARGVGGTFLDFGIVAAPFMSPSHGRDDDDDDDGSSRVNFDDSRVSLFSRPR